MIDRIKAEIMNIELNLDETTDLISDGDKEFIKRIRLVLSKGGSISNESINRVGNLWSKVQMKVVKFV